MVKVESIVGSQLVKFRGNSLKDRKNLRNYLA